MTTAGKSRPPSREEQAKLEIGVTTITRAQKWVLVAGFLALIFAVPVVQQIHEMRLGSGSHWRRLCGLPANAAAVMLPDGPAPAGLTARVFRANSVLLRDIDRFEDDLVEESLLTRSLVPPVQSVLTGALGAGNEKAYVGRGRWLFYRPDVDYLTGAGFLDEKRLMARARGGSEWQSAPQPDPLIAIFQFRRQLAERGIRLIVVPTPVKPVVHPEMFSSRYPERADPIQNPSFEQFRRELANPADFFSRCEKFLSPYADVPAGRSGRSWHGPLRAALDELVAARETIIDNPVLVFDPAPLLAEEKRRSARPQYLETDTHWRPEAVALVASRLKEFIELNAALPARAGAGYQREPLKVANLGDVAAMMKLSAGQTLYPPQEVVVQQVTSGIAQWRPDPGADVLFLGDSFTNIFSAGDMGWGEAAGLVEQLSFEMQRPLDALVRNDAGAHATREMLSQDLARGNDRLAGKKLVIWQFAVRELASGDWRVKTTPMKLGQPRRSGFLQIPAGQQRRLAGVVREASSAPRPGTVTYLDHIVHVHLTDLESRDGLPLPAGDVLVAMYSMRNQIWTNAARYRPGQKVALELRNFDEVDRQSKVGSVKSSLLEGDLTLETPCWAEEPGDQAAAPAGSAGRGAPGPESSGRLAWPELAGLLGVIIMVLAAVRLAERREQRQTASKPQAGGVSDERT